MALTVVGNVTMDRFFWLHQLPRTGETVLATARRDDLGGKGFNQAVNAARTGARTRFVSAIGTDDDGAMVLSALGSEGIDVRHVVSVGGRTDESIILVSASADNCIVSTNAQAKFLTPEHLEWPMSLLDSGDHVLLQGNLSAESTDYCISVARRHGAYVILNTAPLAFDYRNLLPNTDLVIMNSVEGYSISGCQEPREAIARLKEMGGNRFIITLGADGALIDDGRDAVKLTAPVIDAVDTTGAGDTFCGVVAACLSMGDEVEAACRVGVHAASLSTTRKGTYSAFPNAAEINSLRRQP